MSVCSSFRLLDDPISTLENIIEESRQKFKEEMDSYQGSPQVKIGEVSDKSDDYWAEGNRVHVPNFIEMDRDMHEHNKNQKQNKIYEVNNMKDIYHGVEDINWSFRNSGTYKVKDITRKLNTNSIQETIRMSKVLAGRPRFSVTVPEQKIFGEMKGTERRIGTLQTSNKQNDNMGSIVFGKRNFASEFPNFLSSFPQFDVPKIKINPHLPSPFPKPAKTQIRSIKDKTTPASNRKTVPVWQKSFDSIHDLKPAELEYVYPKQAHLYQKPVHVYQNQAHVYQKPAHGYQKPAHVYQNPAHVYQKNNHLYQKPEYV